MVETFVALSLALAVAVDDATLKRLEVLSRVLYNVEKSYVQPVPNDRLVQGAITGIVATLDAYSTYLTPDELKKLKLGEVKIGRTGVLLKERAGGLRVAALQPQSPAAVAGVQLDDEVLAIDEQRNLRLAEAEQRLTGPSGTVVKLELQRAGFVVPRVFSLTREAMPPGAAILSTVDGIACLRITYFPEGVATLAAQQLRGIAKNAPLIVDLRDNPGGLVDQAMRLSELFIDGDLATLVGREGEAPQAVRAQRGPLFNGPLVIVVNHGSASAAEMAAATLKARGRARVLGERTFGKGSIQSLLEFDDGSALKLTTAKYLDPKGRPLDGFGLEPDVVATPSDDWLKQAARLLKALR